MKTTLIVLGLIALASAAPTVNKLGFRNLYREASIPESKSRPRIIGGTEASPHSLPYQVFLEVHSNTEGWYCGGALISQNYVITAAHCGQGASIIHLTLGAHKVREEEETQLRLDSTDVKIHEEFNSDLLISDIAVIKLPEAVSLTDNIQIVALPKDNNDEYIGVTARASGWGLTDGKGDTISDVLRYTDVEVLSFWECIRTWFTFDYTQLCTSGKDSTGTCNGDSGGPLVTDGVLIGVTSFGVKDCEVGNPSGFTRVSSFLDWIASNTDVQIG